MIFQTKEEKNERERGKCGAFVNYNLCDELCSPNPVAEREKEVLQILCYSLQKQLEVFI